MLTQRIHALQRVKLFSLLLVVLLPTACSDMLTSPSVQENNAPTHAVQTASEIPVTPTPMPSPSPLDVMDTVTFTEDKAATPNPERGWYRAYSTDDTWDINTLRAKGITMVLLKANLKDFTNKAISKKKLQEIQNAFEQARKNNLQVIFRAAYDFDGKKSCDPRQLKIILGHIAQLKSILTRNEDILYCVQAGFLGPWGEWHSSYYGDPPSLAARRTVLFALMVAVPKSKCIQVRRPMFIRDIFQDQPNGSALTDATAFSKSNLARTGYHDDALLSTDSECGTYTDPEFSRADELEWVDNQDKFVPFTAESNQLTSYSDPKNSIYELQKLHAQAVDALFHPDVIKKWKATAYNGTTTYDYISQRLGYRFVLLEAATNTDVRKGGAIHLQFSLKNDGFGNLINERPLEIVLSNGRNNYVSTVKEDPRRWFREIGTITIDLYFSIPSDIESGNWNVYLNLPSNYASLKSNPFYSIRFSNTDVWQEASGYNLLKKNILIEQEYINNTVGSFQQITRDEADRLCK